MDTTKTKETNEQEQPSRRHVVLDVETLGRVPGSVIFSVAAVWFDECMAEGECGGKFYTRIDPRGQQSVGLRMDMDTVLWWFGQSEEAMDELRAASSGNYGAPLPDALNNLGAWWPRGYANVWGNGADFDNAMLKAAGDACGVSMPWGYRQNRCLRTLAAVFPMVDRPERLPGEPAHHALWDAHRQAIHLQRLLARINSPREA